MKKDIDVLIIENHPMVAQGIKSSILSENVISETINFKVDTNYNDSLETIKKFIQDNKYFEIIIINVDLGHFELEKLLFGEAQIAKIRAISPNSKVISIIERKENYRINNMIKKYKPEGLIIEFELTMSELINMFKSVIDNMHYYSRTVSTVFHKEKMKITCLDDIDIQILFYLSKGVKNKDLVNFILCSLSTIEKRKQKIKDYLNKDTDKELIEEAILLNLI